ncbi:hypothetical protein AAE478_005673 [Parahypoxylon ruwenzoriense]
MPSGEKISGSPAATRFPTRSAARRRATYGRIAGPEVPQKRTVVGWAARERARAAGRRPALVRDGRDFETWLRESSEFECAKE